MTAFWSGTVARFLSTPDAVVCGTLAHAQIRHFRLNETQQLRAWETTIRMLRHAFGALPEAGGWWLMLEYPMLRLGRRPDVILLARDAIFVIEAKVGSTQHSPEDRRQAEDYAIDLHDFHAGCRGNPIVPILLAECAPVAPTTLPLILGHGVAPVQDANAETLPALLRDLAKMAVGAGPPIDPVRWLDAPYQPVPTIVDAACMLYARHNVAEIRVARTDAANLRATSDAILSELERARTQGHRLILFVTGIPGAGKTLCGLNTIFGSDDAGRGTYLTGNPTLVHVLREALTRDAAAAGDKRSDARRRMESAVQALPKFRDHYVSQPSGRLLKPVTSPCRSRGQSPPICWKPWPGIPVFAPSCAWSVAVRKSTAAKAGSRNGAMLFDWPRQRAASGRCARHPTFNRYPIPVKN